MKRSNGWSFVYAMLVPATLGGFLAGWQRASAQALNPCTACDCKEVIRWLSGPKLTGNTTAFGARLPGTTTDALTAIKFISSGAGCQSNPTTGNGLYDQWSFFYCTPACTLANPLPAIVEMSCGDSGSRTSPDLARSKCS